MTVLAVVVVIDGAPFWGADVGGVLSLVPAYGIAAALLLGWQIRLRNLVLVGASTAAAIGIAAALDMQRAAGQRTHLGRLVEQVQGEGFGAFSSVVRRKLDMNLASLSTSVWRILVPIAVGFIVYLASAGSRPLAALVRRIPELRPTLTGFAILLGLGYAMNDTGILVPGIMLGVLTPVLVALTIPTRGRRPRRCSAEIEVPDPSRVAADDQRLLGRRDPVHRLFDDLARVRPVVAVVRDSRSTT